MISHKNFCFCSGGSPGKGEANPGDGRTGVDLEIKTFAAVGGKHVLANINKTREIRRSEKRLRREQKRLSRKYGDFKKRNLKGEATRQNIHKQRLAVQRIYDRLDCIRTDFINKAVAALNLRDTEQYKTA